MDRMWEELRQTIGETNIAVELICECAAKAEVGPQSPSRDRAHRAGGAGTADGGWPALEEDAGPRGRAAPVVAVTARVT
jgi:hypothetical protein